MESRKHLRSAVQLPISFKGDKLAGEGVVFNLSLEGCAVGSDTTIKPGSYLQLRIQTSQQELPIEVELSAARWSEGREFGLEFIRIRAEEQERLRQFVKSLEAGLGS